MTFNYLFARVSYETCLTAIAAFALPAVLSYLACLLVMTLGPKFGLVDKPGERKIHARPIPTGGGLGIWFGTLAPLAALTLVALGYSPETSTLWGAELSSYPSLLVRHIAGISSRLGDLWTLVGLGTALVLLGAADDRFNLDWKFRLGAEFVVAWAAVAAGWRATLFLDVPWLTNALSALWIVGLINSFNMLDNMDGLSGGTASVCCLFLATVALGFAPNAESGEPQYFLGFFYVLLAGAIFGFLILNRPPARMFMGDGGAYFIGFLLATTTLATTYVGDAAPKSAIFTPAVVLAVPLYDTISVVTIRLRARKSPFIGDTNHFSHRLVALGLTKPQAVATILLTTAICATGAFYLHGASLKIAFLVFGQTILILTLVAVLEFAARKKIRREETALELAKKRESRDQNATFQ